MYYVLYAKCDGIAQGTEYRAQSKKDFLCVLWTFELCELRELMDINAKR